ncbi:MAG: acylphosphatase [Thermoproteota archaeon]|jgi:acylphosphatase
MLEMKLTVKGLVQGVGYRYSILAGIELGKLKVFGFVTNLPNGTVEITAQGDIESLKCLRKIALEGSTGSSVREMVEDINPIDELSYNDFTIEMD